MPRWNLEIPAGLLNEDEKQSMATAITKHYYDRGIPKFFVNVFFVEHPPSGFYAGAQTPAPAVFFIITHAARNFPTEQEANRFHDVVDNIVRPVLEPKGVKWEYNVYQQSPVHWRINGMHPPGLGSDAMEKWRKEDKISGY